MTNHDWRTRALCAQIGGDWWYADNTPHHTSEINTAKAICQMCDVQTQCLEWALNNDERYGIWGGLSAHQRQKLRRKRRIPPQQPWLQPCGTPAAARRHHRRKEPLCPACIAASSHQRKNRKQPK